MKMNHLFWNYLELRKEHSDHQYLIWYINTACTQIMIAKDLTIKTQRFQTLI